MSSLVSQAEGSGASRVVPSDPALVELFAATTASGRTLLSLLDEQPMMLIFLRHLGSLWTRESLESLARAAPALNRRQVRPVLVHMASNERAASLLKRYGLGHLEHLADPGRHLYRAPGFHLLRTTGVKEFLKVGAYLTIARRSLLRHGIGLSGAEDATQLPGVFYLHDRSVYRAFRPKRICDQVDFAHFGA
jgi:hypothetical protein